jgi:putative ABC transport system ATP-binding protein
MTGCTSTITIEGVDHFYGKGGLRRQVLFDVHAEIAAGEIVIVTGPSGSGKTTLLTLLGALRSAQTGSLRILGQELRGARPRTLARLRRQIGYVFQSHNLVEALTAEQNVAMSVGFDRSLSAARRRRRAQEMLEAVGLGDCARLHPGELSGGQRQRVAVARALINEPKLLLADEPTGSLDEESSQSIADLLVELNRDMGVTLIVVTHSSKLAGRIGHVMELTGGTLSERGRP